MRVLGLGTGDDSGAALAEDGQITAAVNEERLSRLKLVGGFPRGSIREVLRLTDTDPTFLAAVLLGARNERFVDQLRPFDGWLSSRNFGGGFPGYVKRLGGALSPLKAHLPFLEPAYHHLLAPSYARDRRATVRVLREELGLTCPIRFVDHHLSHITSAYHTSGFGDALIISLDGGGDGKSSRIYEARNGKLRSLHAVSSFDSLGNYYSYVTILCGFTARKHEGKITGLAASGVPRYVDLLRDFVREEGGTLVNRGGVVFHAALSALRDRLPTGWKREDLAASIQHHFEEVVRSYVGHWVRRTGLRDVALAGGVFANVRVNQVVHEIPGVERVFVHPGMGDGGLSVGAALAACVPGVLDEPAPVYQEPLRDVYLGPSLEPRDVAAALGEHGLSPEPSGDRLESRVAELLARGYVVARAAGRMEYGPRALGNRSILYQPSDPSVNDWLNRNLRRTEFMPFAPAIRYEDAERCFENLEGTEHAAEFMTVTFGCTAWMHEHMAGVVHVDGTARPQLVRRDRNPSFHRILTEFRRWTGLPGVINTSFNMHEEPIVCTADDVVRAFLAAELDYLAIGDRLVKHPHPLRRKLRPVVMASARGGAPEYATAPAHQAPAEGQ